MPINAVVAVDAVPKAVVIAVAVLRKAAAAVVIDLAGRQKTESYKRGKAVSGGL